MPDDFIAPPCHDDIEILFKDDSILLINKPSGLLSLSGKNPLNKDSVHFRLVQQYPSATLVHRLDFGTSGLMLLALNKQINANLTKQFQAKTVSKTYTAIVYGHPHQSTGVIDAPIARGEFPHQKICAQTGKAAQSEYRVMQRMENSSRLLFRPLTGRTHQLRIHSLEVGHPILGCDLYGLTFDGKRTVDMAKRLQLHATILEFDHPTTGERLRFECDSPF